MKKNTEQKDDTSSNDNTFQQKQPFTIQQLVEMIKSRHSKVLDKIKMKKSECDDNIINKKMFEVHEKLLLDNSNWVILFNKWKEIHENNIKENGRLSNTMRGYSNQLASLIELIAFLPAYKLNQLPSI